jgi:hypothetical protein
MFYVDSTVGWRVKDSGINDNVEAYIESTPPEFVSASLGTDGLTYTLTFDENVNIGSGGSAGWLVEWSTAGEVGLTYTSGDGTDTLVYTGDEEVVYGETVADGLDYTQPGDGLEDDAGNDLASFTSESVTNNVEEVVGTLGE